MLRHAFLIIPAALCLWTSLLYLLTSLAYADITIQDLLKSSGKGNRQISFVDSTMAAVDLGWYPPNATWITNLTDIVNGTGVHGFIYNSSSLPDGVAYGTYNWCNMPHVNKITYQKPSSEYTLQYVEVIHRHHKRTPYAANTFPRESYPWYCSDEGLFYYGEPLNPFGNNASQTYWNVSTNPVNPFAPSGFNGTCQFPQITRGGLDDSYQHGLDLLAVYDTMLGFLPKSKDPSLVTYRVTNNVITSQVAGEVVAAMYPVAVANGPQALSIQPASIDSLEPTYTCAYATALAANYSVNSKNANWTTHLNASASLYTFLDSVSGVSPTDSGFHMSFDHYYDNLSSRQCHDKPLPCNITNPSVCVNQSIANTVYREGQYEYSYIYRNAPQSLAFATASYGVWIAELAQNLRDSISCASPMKYRHNIAHDGSISRLLSILQIDVMVWPGMGAEVVFELYKRQTNYYVRVLFGGQVLRSSNPCLGRMDMVDVNVLLAYFDGLVGARASKIPSICAKTS